MAILRIQKERDYSVIDNAVLKDKRLSLKARGLIAFMLSLPSEWNFSVQGLMKATGAGRDAIRTGLQELEKYGYLERVQIHGADGNFVGTDYILHEKAIDTENTTADLPQTENQQEKAINRTDLPTSDFPISDKAKSDLPTSANRPQINTKDNKVLNIASTKEREKDGHSLYRINGIGKTQDEMECQEQYFKLFWQAYPRKTNQYKARLAWESVAIDITVYGKILDAVEAYSKTKQWQDKEFVPYPENFIAQRRWEDDIPVPQAKSKSVSDVANDLAREMGLI